MNIFKFIIKNLFLLHNILRIATYLITSTLVVIALSLIWFNTLVVFWIAVPFVGILGFMLGFDIVKLKEFYYVELEHDRNRRAIDEDNRNRLQLILETQHRIATLLEQLEQTRKRREMHPDDKIITNIEDLYE